MTSSRLSRRQPVAVGQFGVTRRSVMLAGAATASAVSLCGCGGEAIVAAVLPSFAPFFVFSFSGVVQRQIVSASFFPDLASNGKTSGTFNVSNISVGGKTFNFTGTFNERDLSISVTAASSPLASRYNGRFTEDETIVMTPVEAGRDSFALRLDRFVPTNSRFLPALTGNWTGLDAGGLPWKLKLETDPKNLFPKDDPGDATVLLTGTETRGAAAAVSLLGYASVHYIELDIARASGNVRLTGVLQSASVAPPASQSPTTATIVFTGGGSLVRAP